LFPFLSTLQPRYNAHFQGQENECYDDMHLLNGVKRIVMDW